MLLLLSSSFGTTAHSTDDDDDDDACRGRSVLVVGNKENASTFVGAVLAIKERIKQATIIIRKAHVLQHRVYCRTKRRIIS